jgi:hypothetical protein
MQNPKSHIRNNMFFHLALALCFKVMVQCAVPKLRPLSISTDKSSCSVFKFLAAHVNRWWKLGVWAWFSLCTEKSLKISCQASEILKPRLTIDI